MIIPQFHLAEDYSGSGHLNLFALDCTWTVFNLEYNMFKKNIMFETKRKQTQIFKDLATTDYSEFYILSNHANYCSSIQENFI